MRRNKNRTAFTLIELLTVIAIISMLVGLISVGLRKTSIIAKNLRQKSVFHGMDVGLELFAKDFDGYPDSKRLSMNGTNIIGAQHFAEALVGRDGKGFDPDTDWYAQNDTGNANEPKETYTESDASLKRRKDPYLEFKHFEAHTLDEIYPNTDPIFTKNGSVAAPILTDVYNRHVHTDTGKRIGSPILYFKADPSKREWEFRGGTGQGTVDPDAPDWPNTTYSRWVYNLDDNRALLELGFPDPGLSSKYTRHYPDTDAGDGVDVGLAGAFYRFITNEAIVSAGTNNPYRPYNPNTYLLISAGYDGVYGTDDDITNFNY